MKIAFLCGVAVAVLLVGIPAGAQESLMLYDNFEGKTLDPKKWYGGQSLDSGMVNLEMGRLMKNDSVLDSKVLSLSNRSYANIGSDEESSNANTSIFFTDGSNIRTIAATVLVKKIQVPACNTNAYATDVRVRIGGSFFNIDTPTPGSSVNDIFAQITLGQTLDTVDPPGTLHVYGRVYRCDDADCSTHTNIGNKQDLGTAKVGGKVKLRLTWDSDGNQFIFQKGNGTEFIVTYGVSDANGPGAANGGAKRLQIQEFLPNCTSDPRPVGYIEALFDNVKLNASAVP
jgi:hypothetical protein